MGRYANRESFERFYLTKVALGEGCGCAEHATRIRDLQAASQASAAHERSSPIASALLLLPLRRLLQRTGQWVRS